jgi:hypothetical protein
LTASSISSALVIQKTLDHIRQNYNDANGNTVFLSVYEYYFQILAASCPFMDLELLPFIICQAFIDGLDHRLPAGFCTHFPDYSKSQDCAAMHQRKLLQEMLQAALHAETEYNNFRAIALEASGFDGQAFTAQVNASQAEKTITRYSNNNGSNKSGRSGSTLKGPLCCFGCGGPHPWSLLENRIHVLKYPMLATQASMRTPRRSSSAFTTSTKKIARVHCDGV